MKYIFQINRTVYVELTLTKEFFMITKRVLVLIVLIFFSSMSFAAEMRLISDHDGTYIYEGNVELTVTYEIIMRGTIPDKPGVIFYIDELSRKKLPVHKMHEGWRGINKKIEIFFDDFVLEQILGKLADKESLDYIREHKKEGISGKATILIRDYKSYIECDTPHHSTSKVSVLWAKQDGKYKDDKLDEGGC